MYVRINLTLTRVRATVVAVKKLEVFNTPCACL